MLRTTVALPVSYFQREDALDLYFVPELWPGMTASTLPCGWCTNQRGTINLDQSHHGVLVSSRYWMCVPSSRANSFQPFGPHGV